MSSQGALTVEVQGRPRPQGSKTVRRGRALEANPHSRSWRELVAMAARRGAEDKDCDPFTGPVLVHAVFRFARPRTGSPLRRAVPYTSATPDLDKLLRAALDALQVAGVLCNDCQVVAVSSTKKYVDTPEEEGLSLRVQPVDSVAELAAYE